MTRGAAIGRPRNKRAILRRHVSGVASKPSCAIEPVKAPGPCPAVDREGILAKEPLSRRGSRWLICTAICRTLTPIRHGGTAMAKTATLRMDTPTTRGAKPGRSERLEARISKAQKELFVRAADLQGRSLTDFVIASVQAAAFETVRTHDALRLGDRDRQAFVSALLAPPAPAEALKQAAKRYRNRTGL